MSVKSYCRLCAVSTKATNLREILDSNLTFKIYQCFQIQITSNDVLPRSICLKCSDELNKTYDFNERVQKAQEALCNIFNVTEYKKDKRDEQNEDSDTKKTVAVKTEEVEDDDFGFDPPDLHSTKSEDDFSMIDEPIVKKKDDSIKSEENVSESKTKVKVKLESKDGLYSRLKEWENFIWRCGRCSTDFKTVKELRDHYEAVHESPAEYTCTECPNQCKRYDLFRRHVRGHMNKHKYRCDVCGKYSNSKSHHLCHILKHSDVRRFTCATCGKSFKTGSSLYTHNRLHLPEEQKPVHQCDICQKKLCSALSLSIHREIHTGAPETNTCEQCGKGFRLRQNLKQHILYKHSNEKKFCCNLCPKLFKLQNNLRRHVKDVHLKIMRYNCETCGKQFLNSTVLKAHKTLHSGELPFQCEICKKSFRLKKILTAHLRQHAEEKSYSGVDYSLNPLNPSLPTLPTNLCISNQYESIPSKYIEVIPST